MIIKKAISAVIMEPSLGKGREILIYCGRIKDSASEELRK